MFFKDLWTRCVYKKGKKRPNSSRHEEQSGEFYCFCEGIRCVGI